MQRHHTEMVTGDKRKRDEDPYEASQAETEQETPKEKRQRLNRESQKKSRDAKKVTDEALKKKLRKKDATIISLKATIQDLELDVITPEKDVLLAEQQATINTLNIILDEKEQMISTLTARLATLTETNRELQDRLKAPIQHNPETGALAQATRFRLPFTFFPAAPQAAALLPVPHEAAPPQPSPPQPSGIPQEWARESIFQSHEIPGGLPEFNFESLDLKFDEEPSFFDLGLGR